MIINIFNYILLTVTIKITTFYNLIIELKTICYHRKATIKKSCNFFMFFCDFHKILVFFLNCPRHIRHRGGEDRQTTGGDRGWLQGVLCRCTIHALCRQGDRPEAGGEHEQMLGALRQVRRQTAYHFLHRQPAEGCRGAGGAKHEPDVWHRRNGRLEAEAFGILILFNSEKTERNETIRRISPLRHQHREGQGVQSVGRERTGVSRPLRRPCRDKHRPLQQALC